MSALSAAISNDSDEAEEAGLPSSSETTSGPSAGLADDARGRRSSTPVLFSTAAVGVTTAVGMLLAYRRRWLSDDGMIYLRAVRQITAGNGPVLNIGDRAEASTGTLWQWILAALSWATRVPPGTLAVYLGLALFGAALVIGARASRLFLSDVSGAPIWTVPLGLAVVVALPPFWDFATSGLETSLTYAWIASGWLMLVRLLRPATARRIFVTAAFLGLGPLVRPDMAIVSIVFLLAIPRLFSMRIRRIAALAGAALALPLAYEIFRMGYYGEVMPLPAIAKEADQAKWDVGARYVRDFAGPYYMIVPLAAAAIAAAGAARAGSGRHDRARLVVLCAPVAAGLVSALYIARVGGDFMHGRMLLPATFLLALPVFVVRITRTSIALVTAVAAWAALCVIELRIPYQGGASGFIADERGMYASQLGVAHPGAADYRRSFLEQRRHATSTSARPGHLEFSGLFYPVEVSMPLPADSPYTSAHARQQLGMLGEGAPLDAAAVDPLGLAYPLVAHFEDTPGARPGHSKAITVEWLIADYADPEAPLPPGVDRDKVQSARHALQCGEIAELLHATREPMSITRFLSNLVSAPARASLRIPRDPTEAEARFC